jgi:integral membrane protein
MFWWYLVYSCFVLNMLNKVRYLRVIGITEGISFLILLLIAMPLKYFFGWPLAVKVVGWAHGILFVAYIIAVLFAVKAMRWNLFSFGIALLASLLPIGTFILDVSWKKRERELVGEALSKLDP